MIARQFQLGYLASESGSFGVKLRVLKQKKFKIAAAAEQGEETEVSTPPETEPSRTELSTLDENVQQPAKSVHPVTCTSRTGTKAVPTNKSLRESRSDRPSSPAVKTRGGKRRKRKRKPPNPITPYADQALGYFRGIYPKVLGKPDGSAAPQYFVNWARDRTILIQLIRGHGLEHVQERILAFWRLKHRMLKHPDQRYNVALNRIHGADNSIPGFKFVYDTLPTHWSFDTEPKPWEPVTDQVSQ
jgi:hypothetical protein